MGIRSLVSFGLLLLPVAVTLGILFGVDHVRHSSGHQSIFAPPPNNKITTDVFCQLSYGFSPDPGRYTFNPNQWGVTTGSSSLCMNVTFHENGTYQSRAAGPRFTATWQYPQGPESQPVHAFPNAQVNFSEIINATTVQLSNLTSVPVDVSWTYGTGNDTAATENNAALAEAGTNTNICFDIFLDSDRHTATNTSSSAYEVMIWLGNYGLATQPIGIEDGVRATTTVNTTAFNLYGGSNSNTGQRVFTWVAESNTTSFAGDIEVLINDLSSYGGPTSSDYLGYIAFGSEALYSPSTVTFTVSELSVDLVTG